MTSPERPGFRKIVPRGISDKLKSVFQKISPQKIRGLTSKIRTPIAGIDPGAIIFDEKGIPRRRAADIMKPVITNTYYFPVSGVYGFTSSGKGDKATPFTPRKKEVYQPSPKAHRTGGVRKIEPPPDRPHVKDMPADDLIGFIESKCTSECRRLIIKFCKNVNLFAKMDIFSHEKLVKNGELGDYLITIKWKPLEAALRAVASLAENLQCDYTDVELNKLMVAITIRSRTFWRNKDTEWGNQGSKEISDYGSLYGEFSVFLEKLTERLISRAQPSHLNKSFNRRKN